MALKSIDPNKLRLVGLVGDGVRLRPLGRAIGRLGDLTPLVRDVGPFSARDRDPLDVAFSPDGFCDWIASVPDLPGKLPPVPPDLAGDELAAFWAAQSGEALEAKLQLELFSQLVATLRVRGLL